MLLTGCQLGVSGDTDSAGTSILTFLGQQMSLKRSGLWTLGPVFFWLATDCLNDVTTSSVFLTPLPQPFVPKVC